MIDSMEQEDFDIRNQQHVTSGERDFENALRPLNFDDVSGQDKLVDNLRIFVKAARVRGEALDQDVYKRQGQWVGHLQSLYLHRIVLLHNRYRSPVYPCLLYTSRCV